ncbi:ATP-dependent DNA helicase, partial [Pseudomonas aeruginosa]|nr:ATP-dependent DNA helicase [Pseudomonas aeruginosa]
AVEARWLDQARLREVALAHRVCPYYLGQELARWCDLAVGDYNYYFDLGAMLHGLAQVNQWRVAVLVDEAHNLVERGRRMYSAELDQGDFLGVRKTAPEALRKPLERIQRAWNELAKTQADDYQAYDEPPQKLLLALQNAVAAINDLLAEQPQALEPALQEFYFAILQFGRLAELFGEHSLFDIEKRPGRNGRSLARLCLRNVVPAAFL